MKRFIRPVLFLFAAAGLFAPMAAVQPLQAQQADTAAARRLAEQRLGRSVSQAEILERIRASGLTREQAKARLRQMGYDPSMVDPYYDAIEGSAAAPAGPAPEEFARALEELRRAPQRSPDTVRVDTVAQAVADTGESAADSALPRFGSDLFDRVTDEFEPILYGPVDAGYRLGPGDEILLVLSGGVESAYSLEVNRQGLITVPDVGQVPVSGQTLAELDRTLRQYMGRVYSGLVGEDPSIQLQASLGRLRTNQVYIVGEVERPGAAQVSAIATVFNALYRAGGPNEMGTFRNVEVWRGGRVVRTVDLYDYLIHGDSRDDIRLENGDRIHVPLSQTSVAVRGAVRRPAIYELRPGETLRELIGYAGGFQADALVRRVQIDRILPPGQRGGGADRVLMDVDVLALLEEGTEPVPLRDGDVVEVFGVSAERRHRVSISGDVRRPGRYEWVPGSTLWDLITRADGLDESAYRHRIHIYRLNEAMGDRRLISAALEPGPGGGPPSRDVVLEDRDSVVVYSREELRTPEYVHVDGFVKNPGTYPLADGMTLEDLVLAAGGFRDGAHTLDAEVARVPQGATRTDTTAHVLRVGLGSRAELGAGGGTDGTLAVAADGRPAAAAGSERRELPVWRPSAADFRLRHDDRVFIRRAPGHQDARIVSVAGEVSFPGDYVLSRRQERLTDVLARAGGFTSEAYVPGIRVVRDGSLVAVDAEGALRDPGGALDIVLEAGDSLQVSKYDPTVLVQGAVNFEARVLYQPGKSLSYYIDQAGGYRDLADREGVSVTRQNGERTTVRRFLLMHAPPQVTPGSTIFVPAVPEAERSGFDFDRFFSRVLSVASVTATLLIAISQLN